MRKITVSEFVSLDGVMGDPNWTFKYWSDESAAFKFAELFAHDALLLGRVTYEGFAQAWPSQKDEQGYADRMNSMPKHVVSATLDNTTWTNTSVIKSNVIDEIKALKQQDGQDILVFGSDTLVQTLIQNDLVDRYNLLIYPVVLGAGKRLFLDGTTTTLKLAETKSFNSGVTALVYETAPKA
ncbi:MAG: dihydrofolate reductase family protein [Chloroflexota bacterium]